MLVYVRHGDTVLNHPDRDKERLRGHLPVPLSEKGKASAEQAAENLSRHLVAPVDSFSTSPLVRAMQTSETVGRRLGIQATPDYSFADWDTGKYAGQLVKDALPALQALIHSPDEAPPNGEPIRSYLDRLVPAVKKRVATPGVHLAIGHARGSSIIEGLASPVGGVGEDIDKAFLLGKPNLKPGGIMIVPPDWNVKILNPGESSGA